MNVEVTGEVTGEVLRLLNILAKYPLTRAEIQSALELNPTTQLTFVYPVQLTFFVGVTNMNGDSWLVSSRQAPASFQYRAFSSAA